MGKHLILILVSTLLFSCSAKKVNVEKIDTFLKTDSVSVSSNEIVAEKNIHLNITTDSDELNITPIDTTKPIIIDGKKYHNATLHYKKTKVVLVDTTKIKVAKKGLIKVGLKKENKNSSSNRKVNKEANYAFYIWGVVVLVLALAGIYFYKKFISL